VSNPSKSCSEDDGHLSPIEGDGRCGHSSPRAPFVCRGGGGGRKVRKQHDVMGDGRCAIRAILFQVLRYCKTNIQFGDGFVARVTSKYRYDIDVDVLDVIARAFVVYAEANVEYIESLDEKEPLMYDNIPIDKDKELREAKALVVKLHKAASDRRLHKNHIDGDLYANQHILRGAGFFHKRSVKVRMDYSKDEDYDMNDNDLDGHILTFYQHSEDNSLEDIFLNNLNDDHFDLEHHPNPTIFDMKEEPPKKKQKSSKKVDKAEAEAAAEARADAAKDNYNNIIPSADEFFSQSKFAEALKKYREALFDHALPIGCVDARVLNKVLKCLGDLTCCTQDVQALEILLACVQHCIYFINRDDIGRCSITYFYYVNTIILGKLLSSGSDLDDDKFALYYGLLCKCVKICQSSDEIGQFGNKQKTSCTTILNKAKRQMNDRGNTFNCKSKNSFLKLLECINTKSNLVSHAKKILDNQHQEGTVEHILYKLILLGEKKVSDEFSQEDFEHEFNRLRDKLGKLLTTKTGRVINLGNGLSAAHVLFVMMNYATPKSKKWKDSQWTYDKMNPTEACIGFWLQSVITCLERGTGIEKTDEHQSSCISTQDRLFWVCKTNKPRYVKEIPKVCEKAEISEDTMHLIPVILLALKVKYSRMNGHMPSILATGEPVRENLFEVDDTLITRHAIFAGCVPHSELFMRKDRFLHTYPDIEVHHEYSQRLAVFYSQQFSTTSECTFTEDWTGLGNLSPAELEKFLEEHRKLMKENCSRGGKTTGELAQVASALHDVDWNHDDLSPVMQLRFFWCLEHKKRDLKEDEAFDEDDFIDFLIELRDSRVDGGQKGGNTTCEMTKLASVLLDDEEVDGDYNKLSPEWKFIFELHMTRKKIDEDEFIKFLTEMLGSCKKGGKTTGEMQTLYKKLHKVDWKPDSTPELRFAFDLIRASYNNRHKDEEKNQEQFIDYLKALRENMGVKGGSAKTEAKKQTAPWNGIKSGKTREEIDLLNELKDIIVPVVNDIKFTKSDRLGGENDELLKDNLLAALQKFDKTNPTNVKLIEWCGNDNRNKSVQIKATGEKYNYFKKLGCKITCNSRTLGQGLVARSRAWIEIQVIIRALMDANIAHHQYNTTKKKQVTENERKVYLLNLLKTVVERKSVSNKKRKQAK